MNIPMASSSFGNGPAPNKVVGSTVSPTTLIGTTNPTANLVQGIAASFGQNSYENIQDLASRTISVYVMDDWKFNRRLTLNIGMRWDHVGRWYDRQGVGQAVWYPQLFAQDVAENQAAKSMVVEYPGRTLAGDRFRHSQRRLADPAGLDDATSRLCLRLARPGPDRDPRRLG